MTTTAGPGEGPVDHYLDEMFDLLAGTGARGRRMLIEVEEHLAEAAAEGRAHGLDAGAAEREAVERFGPAAAVARQVPGNALGLRLSGRRLATTVWSLSATALTWYGMSGALAWLLSWPWTRLLIATNWFGERRICEPPWLPVPGHCVKVYQQEISVLAGADNDFPYLLTGAAGAALAVGLIIARRTTALGTPSWTLPRRILGWVFAVPFGLIGTGFLIQAVDGLTKDVQYYVLAYLVAGLLALAIAMVALWRSLRAARRISPE